MKFTNEQAVEALRAELTNKGRKTQHVFDRTITTLVETLTKNKRFVDDEMGLPEFVAEAIEILNAYEGDARKKNSDFAKYKESHPDTDPNPATDPVPPKQADDSALKAYEERIAALEKKLQEADTKSVLAAKRKDLTAKLKEKGVKDEKWIEKYLNKVNLTADTDIDAEVEDTLALYNLNKANGGSPVPPANPNGGSNDNALAQSIKAAAALAKQERERANIENKNQ